jgi:hypothetical protein
MKRAELRAMQPLEEILAPDALAEVRRRHAPCGREECEGEAVPIGYVGDSGYAMTAYECTVCGEVEVRR